MNDAPFRLTHRRASRGHRWPYLVLLAAAGLALAACSGGSSNSPAANNPASVAAGSEPVIFNVDSVNGEFFYNGIRPSSIDLTPEDEPLGSNVAAGLVWSAWPSGPRGIVAASATVTGRGKIKNTAQPVTVTLSDPSNGKPSFWQTLTERVHGQQPAVYHYFGTWAHNASGGQPVP
jgi:hypothetical protein